MAPEFIKQNSDWNAEPNDPDERVTVDGGAVELRFTLNPWAYEAEEGEVGRLTFANCARWRLGPTNDHGWYSGQCRYSGIAPAWGEFYEIVSSDPLRGGPADWHEEDGHGRRHFLFYLRDNTFECIASYWRLDRQLASATTT